MINTLVFVGVTFAVSWSFAPRFFRLCDAQLVRQRFKSEHRDHTQVVQRPPKNRQSGSTTNFLSPRHFNELARLTRAHFPPLDAILKIATDAPSETRRLFLNESGHHSSIESVVQELSRERTGDFSSHLLLASMSDGVFIPSALDEAARLLREQQRTQGDLEIAAAQARLTMKVLTRTPLLLLVVLMMVSDSFRSVVASPSVIVVVLIALALNRIAAAWSAHLVRRTIEPSSVDEILDLSSVLSVHLRAGFTLPSACLRLSRFNERGRHIAEAIQDGQTLDEALQPLRDHPHRFGHDFATLLSTAHHDGQPSVEIIGTLTDEARQLRDQQTHIRIRRLPTQLSAPVVLCALPAFMLLIVVPMFLSQLGALFGSLNSIPS